MKSRFRMLLGAITVFAGLALLFAALALPLRLAAQDKQDHSNDNKHHHYTPIDMGTFGGPNSGVEEGTQVVNNRVVAVGDADTSTPDPNYPTCPIFPCDPFIEHAFKWPQGVKTDLGGSLASTAVFPPGSVETAWSPGFPRMV